jgi:hypothetical protein
MSRLRGKLTYANVVATLALFIALGGASAFAATQLAKNSVGTKQIKNGAVTAAKVKSGSLLASNFAAGQIPAGTQGLKGEAGKEGPRGLQGEPGKQGEPGATNVVTRWGPKRSLPTGAGSASYAACPSGETVTGGGFAFPEGRPSSLNYYLEADRPSLEIIEPPEPPFYAAPSDGEKATGWVVAMENNTGSTFSFISYVMCASP